MAVVDGSGMGLPSVEGFDPVQMITKLPIMETVMSSVFDQAQKPEIDEETGKVEKPPVGSNLDDLMKLGKNLSSQMQGVVSTALGIQDQADKNSKEQIAAIKDSGLQDQTIQGILASQKMTTDKHNAEFAGALGIDPNQASSTLLQEGAKLKEARLDMEAKGERYAKYAGANPLDDLGTWFQGLFVGDSAKEGFQAAKERYTAQIAGLREAQGLATDVATRNAALDQVTTTAGIAAQDQKTADETAIKAAQSKKDMFQFDMSAINPIMQATSEQFHAALQVNSAIAQHQALQMEQQRFNMEQDNSEVRNAQKKYQLEEFKDRADYADHMDKAIANYNRVYGANIDGYQGYKNLLPPEKAAVDKLLPSADMHLTAGFDAPQAVENLSNPNVARAPNVGLDQTVGFLQHEMDKARGQGNATGINYKSLTPEGRAAVDRNATDNYTTNSLAGIPDEHNMYSFPSLSKMIALPQVAGSDLAESLKPNATADSRYPTKGVDVVNAGLDLLDKGKSPTAVAKQIVNMYSAGSLLNNSISQYRTVATKVLDPDQASPTYTGYKKVIPGVGVVDMVNEEAVKNMLVRLKLKRQVDIQRAQGNPYSPGAGTFGGGN